MKAGLTAAEARLLLKQAAAAAAQLEADARRRCARQVLRARQRAAKLGRKRGEEAASLEKAAVLTGYARRFRERMAELNVLCLDAAIAAAQNALLQEPAFCRDILLQRIGQALSTFDPGQSLKIFVHPADRPAVEQHLSGKLQPAVRVEEDCSLAPSIARIESPAGGVELDWRKKLDHLRNMILAAWNE